MTEVISPQSSLLRQDQPFTCNDAHDVAQDSFKKTFTVLPVLGHFNPKATTT